MEEINLVRPSSLRPSGALKSTLSGKSTPRGSPSFRRINSARTPRREGRGSGISTYCFRSNRIVLWLLLITLWTYGGFYVQSRWAHGDNNGGIFGGNETQDSNEKTELKQKDRRELTANEDSLAVNTGVEKNLSDRRELTANEDSLAVNTGVEKNLSDSKREDTILAKKGSSDSKRQNASSKNGRKKSSHGSRRKSRSKPKEVAEVQNSEVDVLEEELPSQNSTYGLLVGPFGTLEDRILEWSPEKRTGTCDRKGQFARLVWSRKFVLIFHELSMTGAPLAMMELATELLSCGATVSVVVLSRKGGLMQELSRRKIKVLEDKLDLSFKTAMKADLIIAGSAVCASWIEKYREHTVLGASQIAWWIMENRKEYFDRAKLALNHVKKLIFLSESQSRQWLAWCEDEKIKLRFEPALIPLSVNDELAFVAGIPCSLNTPAFSTENMLEKKQFLRISVRKEMGLTEEDMLVVSLSSINPGKGQLLLLESARILIEQGFPLNNSLTKIIKPRSRTLPLHRAMKLNGSIQKRLSTGEGKHIQKLKILIGSIGSKSNKVPYVKSLLGFLSEHSNVSNSVLWTPATTRVASLYAAADVYVINAQGLGETFGRVTIEAMAFGLPVLGTDAGGTKEILEHNISGLLHPLGRPGAEVLAKNLQYLLENPSARQKMGTEGRKKVEKMFLKKHMYQKFGEVLYNCMRLK